KTGAAGATVSLVVGSATSDDTLPAVSVAVACAVRVPSASEPRSTFAVQVPSLAGTTSTGVVEPVPLSVTTTVTLATSASVTVPSTVAACGTVVCGPSVTVSETREPASVLPLMPMDVPLALTMVLSNTIDGADGARVSRVVTAVPASLTLPARSTALAVTVSGP